MSWWVGPQWRGTGLAEASCRAVLAWLASTRVVTVVEAAVDPDNLPSMALAERLGFHDAGSITRLASGTGQLRQLRRLALRHRPSRDATSPQGDPVAST
jgi:RimJ/RimL family protein N-acetyltransferase